MNTTKVTVKGGGSNLYSVSETSGKYYAYKGSGYGRSQIGTASSFDNALALIKNHSGKEIESIQ